MIEEYNNYLDNEIGKSHDDKNLQELNKRKINFDLQVKRIVQYYNDLLKAKQQQKYVTEYSTSSAAADLQQMFKAEVGRKATAEEIAAYQKQVNAKAAKEPSVTTGITTTSPGMSTTTGTTQTGFNPTEFAREFAQSVPDYAENFAVSNFVKLIDQALSDPNRVGQVVQ